MEQIIEYVKENGIKVTNKNIKNMIALMLVNGDVVGIDGEFCDGVRGLDHNSIYSQSDTDVEFDEIIETIAIISPECRTYYYNGDDEDVLYWLSQIWKTKVCTKSTHQNPKKK